MEYLLLTEYSGKILGPISKYILGPILNGIFVFLDWLPWDNSANVGVAIILFTIVIYLLLLPLTIKQQKFSKLQAKMQPEISAIQEKYKNKKDQDSQMAMNQETQAVYAKYGVSPTGSCVQLLIQMPILFALYRVIYSIPAYVPMVKDAFTDLVSALSLKGQDAIDFMSGLSSAATYTKQFDGVGTVATQNTFIDILNRATNDDWLLLEKQYPDLSSVVDSTMVKLESYNNFLGMNIGYSPKDIIVNAWNEKSYLVILAAVMIPVLAAVTQWINVKLTPGASGQNKPSGDAQADQMAASMKTMNTIMPLFSAFMCFSFSAGIGIYWIAGAVVRSIEQVLINKHIDKMDLDAEIKKNVEKRNARLKKAGIDPNKVLNNANKSTKSISSYANTSYKEDKNNDAAYKKPSSGSLAAKANLVRDYNERNNDK